MIDRNHIIRLVLNKCVSLYDEMVAEMYQTDETGRIYGMVPKVLIIKYGPGSREKDDFILSDIWNTWCYYDGKLEDSENKRREWVKKSISGRFYAEALAEFMIDGEMGHVYLNYYFGPRWAKGIHYILEECDGGIRFAQEETLWVS